MKIKATLIKLISEPYIQFFISGIIIYTLYIYLANPNQNQKFQKDIIITTEIQEHIKSSFEKKWHRKPNLDELNLLIDKYYKEEILIQEALALHLERSDAKIREYLLTKMGHIISSNSCKEPNEDRLHKYYIKHLNRYSIVEKIHFFHVFTSYNNKEGLIELLNMLKSNNIPPQDAMKYGDIFQEGNEVLSINMEKLSQWFGGYFTKEISKMPEGRWIGPLRSSKGLHLIYIVEKIAKKDMAFYEAEERVYIDFLRECREKLLEKSMNKIVSSYNKKIE
jgi:hypothetical protein